MMDTPKITFEQDPVYTGMIICRIHEGVGHNGAGGTKAEALYRAAAAWARNSRPGTAPTEARP